MAAQTLAARPTAVARYVLLSALADGERPLAELRSKCSESGISESSMQRTLRGLITDESVLRVRRGVYQLAEPIEAEKPRVARALAKAKKPAKTKTSAKAKNPAEVETKAIVPSQRAISAPTRVAAIASAPEAIAIAALSATAQLVVEPVAVEESIETDPVLDKVEPELVAASVAVALQSVPPLESTTPEPIDVSEHITAPENNMTVPAQWDERQRFLARAAMPISWLIVSGLLLVLLGTVLGLAASALVAFGLHQWYRLVAKPRMAGRPDMTRSTRRSDDSSGHRPTISLFQAS